MFKKKLIVLLALPLAILFAGCSLIGGGGGDAKLFAVDIVNGATTVGLESFSVTQQGSLVFTGEEFARNTPIMITWTESATHTSTLWLNDQPTSFGSGYVHRIHSDLKIEVKTTLKPVGATEYTVTIVNGATTTGLSSFSVVRNDSTAVSSGQKFEHGTQITVAWQALQTHDAVLWINDQETDYTSGYVLTIAANVKIEVKATPNSYVTPEYTVTIINGESIEGLVSFAVKRGNNTVTTGQNFLKDTQLTVTWQAATGYTAQLWLNGVSTNFNSGYVLALSANTVIEVRIISYQGSGEDVYFSGWSDASRALNSAFFMRYYNNNVFVRPAHGVLEVSNANDLGAISYLTHQPISGGKVPRNNFSNFTIVLTKDIDLSQNLWTPINRGFRGNFDGNGFKITGLNRFTQLEEERPRFHFFSGAGNSKLVLSQNIVAAFILGVDGNVTIKNLTIEGDIGTSGMASRQTAITGWKTDDNTIYQYDNPAVSVSLWGKKTGANLLVSDEVDGALKPSHVIKNVSQTLISAEDVTIYRAWTAAGFVNEVTASTKLVFQNCINKVNITHGYVDGAPLDTSNAFGFLSSTNSDEMTNLDVNFDHPGAFDSASRGVYFLECINYGHIQMHTPLLGVAGLSPTATAVKNCANHGNMSSKSGYMGGLIIGSYEKDIYVRYSYNMGTLTLASDDGGAVGGIAVGQIRPSTSGSKITIRDCANYGTLRSTAYTNVAVGGILAQYNSKAESGRLVIENCLNLGGLDVRVDSQSVYCAGIVARVLGVGVTDIQVVFTSAVAAYGDRGGAIADEVEASALLKMMIKGAIHGAGGSAPIISKASIGTNNIQGFFNYGVVVSPATGKVLWAPLGDGYDSFINRTIDDDFMNCGLGSAAYVVNDMDDPTDIGLMEKLRFLYLGSGQNYRSWFKAQYAGKGSMYLTMSKLTIAEYNFDGSWQSWALAESNAKVSYTFKHEVANKADYLQWTFIGYDTTSADNVVSVRRGAAFSTTIMAFGDKVRLYEKWSLALKSISYKYPDVNDSSWITNAGYASFVDNSVNLKTLKDFVQGSNSVLHRPTVTGYPNLKFQGWYDATRNLVTQITYEMFGEIILFGVFKEAQFEIIYDTFHGHFTNSALGIPPTLISQSNIEQSTVFYLDDYPTPKNGNYVFGGWYLTPDYSGDRVGSINCALVTDNIRLYAMWIDPSTGLTVEYQSMSPDF